MMSFFYVRYTVQSLFIWSYKFKQKKLSLKEKGANILCFSSFLPHCQQIPKNGNTNK